MISFFVMVFIIINIFDGKKNISNGGESKLNSYIDPLTELEKRIKGKKGSPIDTFKFDNPNAFLDFHWGIRTRKSETSPGYNNGSLVQELIRAKSSNYYKQHQALRTSSLEFKERGPANVPGRTRAILVMQGDPDKNTWIAGGVGGGIWKTLNAGQTWELKTPEIPSLAITWLANSDSNPSVIYAATGEANGGGRGLIGNGVLKSTDGGETWSVIASTLNQRSFSYIGRIVVDPEDPDNVILCTTQGEWDSEFRSEIYKSIDGGSSWEKKYDSDSWITQVIAHPSDFNVLYAAKWAEGVIKSADQGETWSESIQGMNKVFGRVELAIAPSDPSRIYASVQGNISGSGADLYVSFDDAENWSVVDQKYNGQSIEFFRGQGDYDNTIAVNPFNEDEVYYGGVNLWKTVLGESENTLDFPVVSVEVSRDTMTFWNFVNFGAEFFNGRLDVGENINTIDFVDVEVRTGEGKEQYAHRFTVEKKGSGVPDSSYFYQDYVKVPFEVWDTQSNTQLMVSFRDQQEDGQFNLLNQNTVEGQDSLHSREYIYIHNVSYSESADLNIAQNGGENKGHVYNQMYFFWPVLRDGYDWEPESLLQDTIFIDFDLVNMVKRSGEMSPVSDAYGDYVEELNAAYAQNSTRFSFHPDHHNLIMVPVDIKNETFKILNSNDGGVYVSNTSNMPGVNDGDWTFTGNGYNTSQFYSVAKKPGEEVYIGGLQDNGTWKSPDGEEPDGNTEYSSVWGGDGFDVLWHYLDTDKFIVSVYNNRFYKTEDNGRFWTDAGSGINGIKPFFSKLASSNSAPDDIYTVSSLGVYRSNNFGDTWELTAIDDQWEFSNFIDIKVSLANPRIIWAGSGMDDDMSVHVSVDGGQSFTRTDDFDEVELGFLSGMATHPYEDSTAYMLFSFAKGPKILRTQDLGKTWEDISGFNIGEQSLNGFPDVAVYSLLVRPDESEIIWAGTEVGIFESSDNGETWYYLENSMGAAAVWEMNVMDDKVVIGTHGRGIFTATLPEPVEVILNPNVIGYGTSLKGDLVIELDLRSFYDSTIVDINGVDQKLDANEKGKLNLSISNLPVGDSLGVKIVSYKRGKSYPAKLFDTKIFEVNDPVQEYIQDFDEGTDDFSGDLFLITKFSGFDNFAVHTKHPYLEGQSFPGQSIDYIFQLRTPIIISSKNSNMKYDDIAIVETGEIGSNFESEDFYDYVVAEGSKDGINWEPLLPGYDANKNSKWLTAYTQGNNGDKSMFVTQSMDLSSTFNANDTIFIRFRLHSDPLTVGWGWAIDNLSIQQTITSLKNAELINEFTVFPNPLLDNRMLTINYQKDQLTGNELKVMNINGTSVISKVIGKGKNGYLQEQINLSSLSAGIYIVEIASGERLQTKRIIVR